jgi:hypothetical protein
LPKVLEKETVFGGYSRRRFDCSAGLGLEANAGQMDLSEMRAEICSP